MLQQRRSPSGTPLTNIGGARGVSQWLQRSRTLLLLRWLHRHQRRVQAYLLAATVVTFVVSTAWMLRTANAHDRANQPSSVLPSGASPRDILRYGQQSFRRPPSAYADFRGPGGLRQGIHTIKTTVSATAASARRKWRAIPANQMAPAVKCVIDKEMSSSWPGDVPDCLMNLYTSEVRRTFPTLLRMNERPTNEAWCRNKVLLFVDGNSTNLQQLAGGEVAVPMSPGRMMRGYISLMEVAGLLSADIVHSDFASSSVGQSAATNYSHPRWQWPVEDRRDQWSNSARNSLAPVIGHYSFGQWLSLRQWESPGHTLAACALTSPARARQVRWTKRMGTIQPNGEDVPPELSALVGANADEYANQLDDLVLQINRTVRMPSSASSPTSPSAPPYSARLAQLRYGVYLNSTFPSVVQPSASDLEQVSGASVDLTRGWEGVPMDPRIGVVLETRLWVRLTMLHLMMGHQQDRFTPTLLPLAKRDAWLARMDNYFLSRAQIAAAAEVDLRAGGWMTSLKHGFDINTHGRPHARDNLYTHADKTWDDHYTDRWAKKHTVVDPHDVLNAWEPVHEAYFSSMIHVALVWKQARKWRRMAAASSEEGLTEEERRGGFMSPPADDQPEHMHFGVPLEYLDSTITFHAGARLFLSLHAVLPHDLRRHVVLTLFVDAVGVEPRDMQPLVDRFRREGVQVRLLLNLPLAIQVQAIALSDVQFYFCHEERIPVDGPTARNAAGAAHANAQADAESSHGRPDLWAEDRLDYGTCGLPAFFRSEPLKVFVSTAGLAEVYPFVRNVLLVDMRNDGRAGATSQADALAAESEMQELRRESAERTVDLGRSLPRNSSASVRKVFMRRNFPDRPQETMRMATLEDIPQRLVLQHTPSTSAADSPTQAFIERFRRVHARKMRRLRSGGVPDFLENYTPDYPREHMLIPEQPRWSAAQLASMRAQASATSSSADSTNAPAAPVATHSTASDADFARSQFLSFRNKMFRDGGVV